MANSMSCGMTFLLIAFLMPLAVRWFVTDLFADKGAANATLGARMSIESETMSDAVSMRAGRFLQPAIDQRGTF